MGSVAFNLPLAIALLSLFAAAFTWAAFRRLRKRRELAALMARPLDRREAVPADEAQRPAIVVKHQAFVYPTNIDVASSAPIGEEDTLVGRLKYRVRHPLADKSPSTRSNVAPRAADGSRPTVFPGNYHG